MGMKLYYKYEWDDKKRNFFICKRESGHRAELKRDIQLLVSLMIKDIKEKSGLDSRLNSIIILVFFLFSILLLIVGAILIRYEIWIAGILFLAMMPFISFSIYISQIIRGSRFERLQKFIFESDEFYKEMLQSADLAMSCYFFESRLL